MSGERLNGEHVRAVREPPSVLAEVDLELRRALSVSPSPDFEVRVVQRIAADRPVLVGFFGVARGLKTAGLLAAASIVIVPGLFYALNRTPVVAPPAMPRIVEGMPVHKAPAHENMAVPGRKAPAHKNTSEPPRVQRVHASASAPRTEEPEVILPVNQMEAVRRLVRAVNEGRIAAPTEPVETPVAVPLEEVVVAPLVVDPIPVPALEPGAETSSQIIRGHK